MKSKGGKKWRFFVVLIHLCQENLFYGRYLLLTDWTLFVRTSLFNKRTRTIVTNAHYNSDQTKKKKSEIMYPHILMHKHIFQNSFLHIIIKLTMSTFQQYGVHLFIHTNFTFFGCLRWVRCRWCRCGCLWRRILIACIRSYDGCGCSCGRLICEWKQIFFF